MDQDQSSANSEAHRWEAVRRGEPQATAREARLAYLVAREERDWLDIAHAVKAAYLAALPDLNAAALQNPYIRSADWVARVGVMLMWLGEALVDEADPAERLAGWMKIADELASDWVRGDVQALMALPSATRESVMAVLHGRCLRQVHAPAPAEQTFFSVAEAPSRDDGAAGAIQTDFFLAPSADDVKRTLESEGLNVLDVVDLPNIRERIDFLEKFDRQLAKEIKDGSALGAGVSAAVFQIGRHAVSREKLNALEKEMERARTGKRPSKRP